MGGSAKEGDPTSPGDVKRRAEESEQLRVNHLIVFRHKPQVAHTSEIKFELLLDLMPWPVFLRLDV